MAKVLSHFCKLIVGSTPGTSGTTTDKWDVKSVSLSISGSEVDVTDRSSDGWKSYMNGLKDASLTIEAFYDSADTKLAAVRTAFLAGTALPIDVMDNNSKGLQADWVFTSFDLGQSEGEAVTVSISAKVSTAVRNPSWTAS